MSNLPRRTSTQSIVPIVAATTTLAGLGLVLGWIAYSRTRIRHDIPLTAALDAELRYFDSPTHGPLAYYSAGPARSKQPPVLLIHSVNAAASSFEMRPVFERLAATRRVYALELPGFGFSTRQDRDYTPELMRDAILSFVHGPLKKEQVDVVALSLGCEFAALAAAAQPKLFKRLVFLSPTGFGARNARIRPNDRLHTLLNLPLWRRPLFDLLTTRVSMRQFLKQSSKKPLPPEFGSYAYETTHQPDAENAPYAFVAFKLFTRNIAKVYRDLKQPGLLIHGKDPFTNYDSAPKLLKSANWQVMPIESAGSLVHWDYPELVTREIETHLA